MEKLKKWIAGHGLITTIMVLTAILAPLLYSLSFVKSMWDPYAGAKNLPIAVVNDDQAVKYQGKTLAVGDQTVAQLKKNHSLKWIFVNKKKAEKGIKNRQYYTVVTIPKNFSKNATTVLAKHPKKMQLKYQTNDSLNYLAESMSEVGVKSIDSNIRASVTKAYASAMFSQLAILGKGMSKAANGAQQISDGTVTLKNGAKQYVAGVSKVNDGLQTLKVSVEPLKSGASQLASGAQTLASGINKYTNGISTLYQGTDKLTGRNSSLTSGVWKLENGVSQYTNGVSQLNSGLISLSSNSAALRSGASQLQTASGQFGTLNNGAQQVANGVKSFSNNLQSSNIVNQLTAALAMQNQVTSLEGQLTNVQSVLKTLSSIDINGLNKTVNDLQNQVFDAAGNIDFYTPQDDNSDINQDAEAINSALSNDKNVSSDTKQKVAALVSQIKDKTAESNKALNSGSDSWGNLLNTLIDTQSNLQPTLDSVSGLSKQIPTLQNTMNQAQSLLTQTDNLLTSLKKNEGLLSQMPSQLSLLTSATSQIATGTQKLADSSSSINTLVTGINQYTNGVDKANVGAGKLSANNATLNSSFVKLATGINQYTNGVSRVNAGTSLLNSNSGKLNSGAGELSSALTSLNQKVPSLVSGVDQLASGTQTLDENSGKLIQGMSKLQKGSGTLSSQLAQGANKVNSTNGKKQNAAMFGSPTKLTHTAMSHVQNYGHALAPFAMATGLFIGVLIFTLEFPASRELKNLSAAKKILFNQFKLAFLVSVGMILVLNVIMMLTGLKVDHVADLFWISLIYTWAQMAIMQLLTLGMGRFGTIVGLLIFVASIGASGGMFPMQTTAPFFNMIHPFLPMTYAINGLRQAITGGLGANYAVNNGLILLVIAILAYILFLILAIALVKNKQIASQKETELA